MTQLPILSLNYPFSLYSLYRGDYNDYNEEIDTSYIPSYLEIITPMSNFTSVILKFKSQPEETQHDTDNNKYSIPDTMSKTKNNWSQIITKTQIQVEKKITGTPYKEIVNPVRPLTRREHSLEIIVYN
jgi:hypothetical protein